MIQLVCGPFREETLELCLAADVAGDIQFLPFKKTIIWNKATESVVKCYYNGRFLKEFITLNDYYGFETSVTAAAEEAEKIARTYKVTKDAGFEIMVVTSYVETPYIQSSRCKKTDLTNKKLKHELESVHDSKWLYAGSHKRLESIDHGTIITWSSKNGKQL